MSEPTMPTNGAFCWNELATTDLGSAVNFYRALLGWEIKEGTAPGGGMAYNEIVVDGRHVGGMYTMPAECGAGVPSHWMAYVAVGDVDAKAEKVTELGGKVIQPPFEIPGVGRMCLINDPTGAAISLITLKGGHD